MSPFVPPSTTTYETFCMLITVVPQYGDVSTALGSKKSVIGFRLVPLPEKLRYGIVAPVGPTNVPHKWTVVPGPIWLAPVPQLAEVLKKVTAYAVAQLCPVPAPVAACAM